MFDPRYLLLTSKERKQVFEKYVKERAEEERREKRNKMKERKEQFQKLLEEANLHGKYVKYVHWHINEGKKKKEKKNKLIIELFVRACFFNLQIIV